GCILTKTGSTASNRCIDAFNCSSASSVMYLGLYSAGMSSDIFLSTTFMPLLFLCRFFLALPHLYTTDDCKNTGYYFNSGLWIDEDSYRSGNGCDPLPCRELL